MINLLAIGNILLALRLIELFHRSERSGASSEAVETSRVPGHRRELQVTTFIFCLVYLSLATSGACKMLTEDKFWKIFILTRLVFLAFNGLIMKATTERGF